MKIEIFGTGCPKCEQLTINVKKAAEELGIEPDIQKVTNIDQITNAGIFMTPALAVEGKVVCSGKVLNKDEVKKFLVS